MKKLLDPEENNLEVVQNCFTNLCVSSAAFPRKKYNTEVKSACRKEQNQTHILETNFLSQFESYKIKIDS